MHYRKSLLSLLWQASDHYMLQSWSLHQVQGAAVPTSSYPKPAIISLTLVTPVFHVYALGNIPTFAYSHCEMWRQAVQNTAGHSRPNFCHYPSTFSSNDIKYLCPYYLHYKKPVTATEFWGKFHFCAPKNSKSANNYFKQKIFN
jgi:hypothetical protein